MLDQLVSVELGNACAQADLSEKTVTKFLRKPGSDLHEWDVSQFRTQLSELLLSGGQ